MKLARRGTSGRHFSGILRDADRNFNTALHWSTTTELRHAISEAKAELMETKRVLEKAQSEAQRAYYEAERAREMREARARWRTIERRSFATCRRVLSEVGSFKSKVNSMARTDPRAAEAYIAEHRHRIQGEFDDMEDALSELNTVLGQMRRYGESDQAIASFGSRIRSSCSP